MLSSKSVSEFGDYGVEYSCNLGMIASVLLILIINS